MRVKVSTTIFIHFAPVVALIFVIPLIMHFMPETLRVTSVKDQKMSELEKIDFLHTQPSEAY